MTNPFDQYYAVHVFEKSSHPADKWIYIVLVLACLVVYLYR